MATNELEASKDGTRNRFIVIKKPPPIGRGYAVLAAVPFSVYMLKREGAIARVSIPGHGQPLSRNSEYGFQGLIPARSLAYRLATIAWVILRG
jgi:hypothetical protein